jgi:acyl-CoA reductase-like NAD-dependent aldehyde dehydrogenase
VARQILSGQVHINSAPLHDAQVIPHGGLKKSGYGRFNGLEGLREFTTIRTITFSTPHDQYPM